MFQPAPFVVEVVKQPPPTPDISVSVVIGVLLMPLIAMAAAGIGGLCVGGIIVLYKRWREGSHADGSEGESTRLRI